jgi:hypothetical protein
VVGVSWLQANEFCKWRTDRVNEAILVREGIIQWHFADIYNSDVDAGNNTNYDKDMQSKPENMFSTENYLNGNYTVKNNNIETDTLALIEDGDDKAKYLDKNGKYKYRKSKDGKNQKKYSYNVGKEGPETGTDIPRDPYQLTNYDPLYADLKKGEVICLGKRALKMEDGVLLPNYRLPTEAEWEFAALGLIGNHDPDNMSDENIINRNLYPWNGHYVREDDSKWAGAIQANFMRGKGDMMGMAGNHNDGADITTGVKEFLPNDYGLYNMSGNVAEWTSSPYEINTYSNVSDMSPDVRSRAKDSDPTWWKRKVIRGGSWKDVASFLQVSSRDYEFADTAKAFIGFRCIIEYIAPSLSNKTPRR